MADKLSRKRTVGDPPTSAQRFARNALWLIALNLFLRTVGVSFNVYLAGRAGGEVMGLYSLILGVYGFFTTLGGGGAHLGCTRLIAETMGRFPERGAPDPARQAAISHVLRVSLGYALLCGVGAGVMLFPAAPYIGRVWLGDLRTIPSLRVLALSLPVVSLSGCLSGYFTGMRRVALPSLTGVVSQVLRLGLCAALLGAWLPRGASYACLALVVGSSLAETAGLVLSALACLFEQRRHGGRVRNERLPTGKTHLLSRLLHITVPVTVAACLRSGLLTLQHALIPRGLRAVGASWSAALASYGVIHGVVLPVVLFPSVFVSSFSGLLVPEIAEANARGHHRRVAHVSGRVVSVALLFSFGAAGLMCCFSAEIGQLICGSREAGAYIRILAPLIPIMYVDSSVDGVLKGMGQQVYSMTVNIIDALTSVILVWFLLPRMGLNGYIISVYVTETLNTTLSLCRMLRISRMRVRLWHMAAGPLLCVVAATWTAKLFFGAAATVPGVPGMILHLCASGALYVGLLFLLRVVSREEARGLLNYFGRGSSDAAVPPGKAVDQQDPDEVQCRTHQQIPHEVNGNL